jgi:hypothetical protein
MQTQNWQRILAVATVTVLIVSFTTLAVAQRVSSEDRNAIFAAAPRIQTSVKGVTVIAGPPKGFNPLTATNRELLSYGLPQAPDKTVEEGAYRQWAKAMSALQACNERSQAQGRTTSSASASNSCQATDVTARPFSSTNARSSGKSVTSNADGTSSLPSSIGAGSRIPTITRLGAPRVPSMKWCRSGMCRFPITPLATSPAPTVRGLM